MKHPALFVVLTWFLGLPALAASPEGLARPLERLARGYAAQPACGPQGGQA